VGPVHCAAAHNISSVRESLLRSVVHLTIVDGAIMNDVGAVHKSPGRCGHGGEALQVKGEEGIRTPAQAKVCCPDASDTCASIAILVATADPLVVSSNWADCSGRRQGRVTGSGSQYKRT
jgi:hypothetical protein